MSKNKKYGRIDPEDFLRYISGEMSDEERHAIEREIQKDPFAADALEGLSIPDTGEARKDLSKLKARLIKRVAGRRSMVWIRVAASVAVIVVIGTLYFTVFTDKIGQMDRRIAETESAEPAREPGAAGEKKAPEKATEETITAEETPSANDIQEESPTQEGSPIQETPVERRAPERSDAQPVPAETYVQVVEELAADSELMMEDEFILAEMEADAEEIADMIVYDTETMEEPVIPDEEIMAEAAAARSRVSTLAKSTTLEEGKGEEITGMDEARMIPDSIPAMPSGGMELFNRYITDNLRFPEDDSIPGESVVVLSFIVGPQGRPQNINADESPDEAFSLEAIRLLQEGPAWSPLIVNGMPSEERVRINIEFKKE